MLDENNLVSPEITFNIGGKECVLQGTFQNLKKLQHAFEMDIAKIPTVIGDGSTTDLAKFISTITGIDIDEVEEWVIQEEGIVEVRCALYEFMCVSVAPKKKRSSELEKARYVLAAFKILDEKRVEKLKEIAIASLGLTTKDSA